MPEINLAQAFISFSVGFVLAIITDPIKNALRRARLSVHFDGSDDMVLTPDDKHEFALYTKVKIKNRSRFNTARKVRCYLVEIEKKIDGVENWEKIFDVPLALAWAYLDYEPLDIPPRMWVYFNTAHSNKGENQLLPTTKAKPFVWNEMLRESGSYKMTFYVTGDNIRNRKKGQMIIEWKGEWNSFTVSEFKVNKIPKLQ